MRIPNAVHDALLRLRHSEKRDRGTTQVGEQVEARNMHVIVCHPGQNSPHEEQKMSELAETKKYKNERRSKGRLESRYSSQPGMSRSRSF